jgi:hypothetical protein
MTEASRFIRYAMPGAVFLAVGLWLLIDPRGVDLEPLSEPAVAALVQRTTVSG